MKRVNLFNVELDHVLDHAGFRHRGTAIGEDIGAERIGAGVYDAEEGFPIWPYHYHHGVEEWLHVITGTPVLREPAGERALAPGDLVCFPSGHVGAHAVKGPGRFVIFSAGRRPSISVYPDSDKVSGPGGILLLRSSAVDYWHGEGTAGRSAPVDVEREPESSTPRQITNVSSVTGPVELGGERLQVTIVSVDPGAAAEPYHYVHGREEWLLVFSGEPTLRHAHGEDELDGGDVVCFAEGPDGAHSVLNRTESVVRALLLSTTGLPANVCYPESGQWLLHNGPGRDDVVRAS